MGQPPSNNNDATRLTSAPTPDTEATRLTTTNDDATRVTGELEDGRTRVNTGSLNDQAATVVSSNTTSQKPTLSGTRSSTRTNTYGYGIGHRVAPTPGARVLRDRFELIEPPLGSGGMGDVFLARDLVREEMQDSSPLIALKLLNETCRTLPGALQALQREAKKAQTLSHPNIVTVFDFDRDGEDAFITMEYLKGEPLKDYLRKQQKLPLKEGLSILDKIARGLAYAHQEGFVHADIKPANIYLTDTNLVKILDLGIAHAFTEAKKDAPSAADELTKNALTPAYASVQMLQGEDSLPADDIYALGCVAYEIFAGRHPFLDEKARAIQADEAQRRGMQVEIIPQLPKRYMRAIKKALSFDREARFKDAGAFIDAIKPRNLKKDLALLSAAVITTGIVIFGANLALKSIVPPVESLPSELTATATAIIEGDSLLAAGDIDMAHRLYAESWEATNQIPNLDPIILDRAQMILRDRMTQIAKQLIKQSKQKDLDEFHLRELANALEFMRKDEIANNLDDIDSAIRKINKRLSSKP
jgi:serine/threonine protein kinase